MAARVASRYPANMDASPPESNGTLARDARTETVVAALEEALTALDELGHGLAGCYVSTAVELIRSGHRA